MKQLYPLLLLVLLGLSSAGAQPVPETQLPLITKVTASWCPLCGTWGWTLFEGIVEDNADQAVLVAAHYSGDLVSSISQDWAINFGATGQPQFFLDNERQSAGSTTVATARTAIAQKTEQANQMPPLAQTGIQAEYDENEQLLLIETNTRFFASATGDFYLGIYLLEKSHIGPQSGQGNNAQHKYVMRRSLSGNSFGSSLGNGSFAMGQEISSSGSFTLETGQAPEDYRIASVIWQKVGDTYEVINSNFTEEINEATRIDEVSLTEVQWQVGPVPAVSALRVDLQLERPFDNLELSLHSLDGRRQQMVFRGALPAGDRTFTLQRPAAGIYFLRLRDGDRQMTRRVVFQ